MKNEKLERINELARKSRTQEGLTDAEKQEQAELRREYIEAYRANLRSQLDSIVLVNPDGTHTPLAKKSDEKLH